jgi:hypothetical protein
MNAVFNSETEIYSIPSALTPFVRDGHGKMLEVRGTLGRLTVFFGKSSGHARVHMALLHFLTGGD